MGPIIISLGEVMKRYVIICNFFQFFTSCLPVLYTCILFHSIPLFSREKIASSFFFLHSTNYRKVLKVKMHRPQAYH